MAIDPVDLVSGRGRGGDLECDLSRNHWLVSGIPGPVVAVVGSIAGDLASVGDVRDAFVGSEAARQ